MKQAYQKWEQCIEISAPVSQKSLDIIYLLRDCNVFLNLVIRGGKCIIWPMYSENGHPAFHFFVPYSKCQTLQYHSYKDLIKIGFRYPGDLVIVSTTGGIMLHHDAIALRLGGQVLFWVRPV